MKQTKKKKSTLPLPIDQLEVLNDRCKLREYCIQNGIKTPDFFASDQCLKISQWAMKKNTFPLCLKSAENFSNNNLIFVLKAYRELPEFFETIQSKTNNGKVIIEEFIEGKAFLEVSVLEKKVRLITQIGLNKMMKLQQRWRAFPIKLPDNIFAKIDQTIKSFDKLLEKSENPLRFSFVIKNLEPILISINTDDKELVEMRENINKIVHSFKGVLQMHGFFANKEEHTINFDIITDFEDENKENTYKLIYGRVSKMYPDYKINITLDIDVSD